MEGLDFSKIQIVLKKETKKLLNLSNLKDNLDFRRKLITSERFGELDVFRIALPQIPSNGNIFLI